MRENCIICDISEVDAKLHSIHAESGEDAQNYLIIVSLLNHEVILKEWLKICNRCSLDLSVATKMIKIIKTGVEQRGTIKKRRNAIDGVPPTWMKNEKSTTDKINTPPAGILKTTSALNHQVATRRKSVAFVECSNFEKVPSKRPRAISLYHQNPDAPGKENKSQHKLNSNLIITSRRSLREKKKPKFFHDE